MGNNKEKNMSNELYRENLLQRQEIEVLESKLRMTEELLADKDNEIKDLQREMRELNSMRGY